MTTEVVLTQGFVALVDDDDAPMVLAHKWCAFVTPSTVYAVRGIKRADGGRTTTRLHNFLTGWKFVDHVDGNGLDCRRANLRPATYAQNTWNQKRRSSNTSGYKGVHFEKRYGKWEARIRTGDRRLYLGRHATPEDAARAYDAAAIEHHGEFARLNFPPEETS